MSDVVSVANRITRDRCGSFLTRVASQPLGWAESSVSQDQPLEERQITVAPSARISYQALALPPEVALQ
jgi:hypothetical protein